MRCVVDVPCTRSLGGAMWFSVESPIECFLEWMIDCVMK